KKKEKKSLLTPSNNTIARRMEESYGSVECGNMRRGRCSGTIDDGTTVARVSVERYGGGLKLSKKTAVVVTLLLVVASCAVLLRGKFSKEGSSAQFSSLIEIFTPSSSLSPLLQNNKQPKEQKRPNIVFWMADDMQLIFDDQPVLPPGKSVHTAAVPEHERVRAESGVFTQAYSTAPKCAPARFNILTMKYCSRSPQSQEMTLGKVDPSAPYDGRVTVDNYCRISPEVAHETLPAVLSRHGYETIQSGKWHLNAGEHDWSHSWEETVASIHAAGFTKVGGALRLERAPAGRGVRTQRPGLRRRRPGVQPQHGVGAGRGLAARGRRRGRGEAVLPVPGAHAA
ncbi:unnamed protein product, partial [Heterosigma akashiwo]